MPGLEGIVVLPERLVALHRAAHVAHAVHRGLEAAHRRALVEGEGVDDFERHVLDVAVRLADRDARGRVDNVRLDADVIERYRLSRPDREEPRVCRRTVDD